MGQFWSDEKQRIECSFKKTQSEQISDDAIFNSDDDFCLSRLDLWNDHFWWTAADTVRRHLNHHFPEILRCATLIDAVYVHATE